MKTMLFSTSWRKILIIYSIVIFNYSEADNNGTAFIPHSVSESIKNALGDKLDQNFRTLSSQLNENGRQVAKTLSLFESEWRDKTARLTAVEESQHEVRTSLMKLTQAVTKIQGFQAQLDGKLNALIRTPSESSSVPPQRALSEDAVDIDTDISAETDVSEDHHFETVSEVIFVNPDPTEAHGIQQDASIFLTGTPDNFRVLDPIALEDQGQLSSLELHYVLIDPQVLAFSLQNCSNLKSLVMLHVQIIDGWNTTANSHRVVLPSLKNFVVDQVGVLNFRNDTIFSKWTEIDEFLKGMDKNYLKRIIFFDKDPDSDWNLDNVTSLGINLDIRVDGIRIFGLNYDQGEISSMLKSTSDLLLNLDPQFVLKKLSLSTWRPELDLLPDSLTHLNMNYVLDLNENTFKDNLLQLRNLQELNIFIGNQRDFGQSLRGIPLLQLKNLTIRYSDLRDFPRSSLMRLDHLYLHLCQIDLEFVQDFPHLFEVVHVGVTFRKGSGTLQYSLLRTILTTPVEFIFMKNFNRTTIPVKDTASKSMEQFLIRSGLGKTVENFVLEKKSSRWEGKSLGGAELAEKTLQLMGTDKFVTFNTYQKIFSVI